jgi:hypothetical protein
VVEDEDQILVAALGAVGGSVGAGGARGARFAAKRLKKDVCEVDLELPLTLAASVEHVSRVLAEAGSLIEGGETQASAGQCVVRAIVGGGSGGMNPVLVTVRLSHAGPERTAVVVRGAAKEGLIKQRAGEKTAKQLAQVLAL